MGTSVTFVTSTTWRKSAVSRDTARLTQVSSSARRRWTAVALKALMLTMVLISTSVMVRLTTSKHHLDSELAHNQKKRPHSIVASIDTNYNQLHNEPSANHNQPTRHTKQPGS